MAHSSRSRTTRFQREKLGALPGWATNLGGVLGATVDVQIVAHRKVRIC